MIYRKKEGAACEFPGRNLDESNLVQWANLTVSMQVFVFMLCENDRSDKESMLRTTHKTRQEIETLRKQW